MTSRRGFRLLALDIDGTLLDSNKGISPRTRAALDAARAAGVRLVLVTGRRYPSTRRLATELGGDIPLVLHNGALIVEDGRVLRCRPLARDTARVALREGRARGAEAVVHCGLQGEGWLLVENPTPAHPLLAYYLDRSSPDVVAVRDLVADLAEDPVQVMYGGDAQAMERLRSPLAAALAGAARIERTVYPANGVAILDVLNPEVGKAEALAFLVSRWGFEVRDTLAIGDNWNDREMLERAGLGLVMGNAAPGLHRLGLPVLPSNDQDGVAVAIERYLL